MARTHGLLLLGGGLCKHMSRWSGKPFRRLPRSAAQRTVRCAVLAAGSPLSPDKTAVLKSAAQCSCPFPTATCEVATQVWPGGHIWGRQARRTLAELTLRHAADSASRQAVAAAAAESCRLRAHELRAFMGDMRGTAAANCLLDQTVLRQAGLIWVWLDLTESGHEKQAHSRAVACARHTRRVVPAHRPACQRHRQSRRKPSGH